MAIKVKIKKSGKEKPVFENDKMFSASAAETIIMPVEESVEESLKIYGHMTVEDRAIPDYRDGLKPVHRRVIWAMKDMNLMPNGHYVKSAKVVGHTLGSYHPHSDKAVYDSACGMIEGTPFPLLAGQGNFGWYEGSSAAAMRYTEMKLGQNAADCLLQPKYLAVTEMVPTYDNSTEEPVVLPAMLPMILVLGCKMGIAVGTTTRIPSFTVESVQELVKNAAEKAAGKRKTPSVSLKDCWDTLEFSSAYGGEYFENEEEFKRLAEEGRGKVEWQCSFTEDPKGFTITGIPPEWNAVKGIARLANLNGVKSASEQSSGETISIRVELQPSAKLSDVRDSFLSEVYSAQPCIINVTERYKVEGEYTSETKANFYSWGLAEIVNRWFEWRMKLETKALNHEIGELQKGIDKRNLMLLAIQNLDYIHSLLKKKGIDKAEALAKKLKIELEESRYIWQMAIGRFDRLSEEALLKANKDDGKKQAHCRKLLKNPALGILESLN